MPSSQTCSKALSDRRKFLIMEFLEKQNFPVSMSEIARNIGVKNSNHISSQLEELAVDGKVIIHDMGSKRNCRLIGEPRVFPESHSSQPEASL